MREQTRQSEEMELIASENYVSKAVLEAMAAGKPVIVQDTGFSKVLPVGDGILIFTTLDEAVSAIHEVEENYQQHSQSALVIAKEYFCSDKVLSNLLDKCNF